jgi:hypothetical protein
MLGGILFTFYQVLSLLKLWSYVAAPSGLSCEYWFHLIFSVANVSWFTFIFCAFFSIRDLILIAMRKCGV